MAVVRTMQAAPARVAARVIGAGIRRLREQRGLTLEQLASSAGISYQYLSGIETGKENFSILILEKISRALDLSVVSVVNSAYDRDGGRRPG